jgi:hypothetical protein
MIGEVGYYPKKNEPATTFIWDDDEVIINYEE